MKLFRQGDVLLKEITALPEDAVKETRDGRIVLAYGEATGHAHAIEKDEASLYTAGARRFLEVCYQATLNHEEHAPIKLPQGLYEVIEQRQYSREAIANVGD